MGMSLESLFVGLFAFLPGFLCSSVRSVFTKEESSTTAAWTVTSVLISLAMNAVSFVVYIWLFGPAFDSSDSIQEISSGVASLSVSTIVDYLCLVYIFAFAWGLITGLARHYSLRHLAFLYRLTPIAPERDVFHRTLGQLFRTKDNMAKRGNNDQLVPWLKIDAGNRVMFGRLRSSNNVIHQDKPIEVYLAPAFSIENSSLVPHSGGNGASSAGFYLRIRPEQVIEIFSARADWRPDLLGSANHQ
jgi:hypothetical protein